MATETGAVMVTCAAPAVAPSAAETAETVTTPGVGTVLGAVYTPLCEIVPMRELPPETPLTSHVTLLVDAFATVAVKD
jgi:hypothetical protein